MRTQSKFYSLLDERRTDASHKKLESVTNAVAKAEDMHYRSLAFVEAARKNFRKVTVNFLFEWNGLSLGGSSAPFTGNKLREKCLVKREHRLKEYCTQQKQSRQVAQASSCSGEDESPILLLEAEDTTHYGVLGVSRLASKIQISGAFRRLARLHHPDKSKNENAAAIFLCIKEARDILMCDERREAYNSSLDNIMNS